MFSREREGERERKREREIDRMRERDREREKERESEKYCTYFWALRIVYVALMNSWSNSNCRCSIEAGGDRGP